MKKNRIYLSPPHMGTAELEFVQAAFESNWIAPAGPDISSFEKEFCEVTGCDHAVAVSSGTAALHLALLTKGITEGDEVFCSDFTFAATANAIRYVGARPVFVDSDPHTWNMDPTLLEQALKTRSRSGRLPKALILVHLYGQSADFDPIARLCQEYGVHLIEDAAEALGATYKGKSPGSLAEIGIFSFNGNKIITTSGGGMFVSQDKDLADRARYLSTQARQPVVHYEHTDIGYNYRMSNILAAIGRGQLQVLENRVTRKREIFDRYKSILKDLPGLSFIEEAEYGTSNHWLTCITVDPTYSGTSNLEIMQRLEDHNIESRPTWKPMHLQPVFKHFEVFGGEVSARLYNNGLCLPSGTSMSDENVTLVAGIVSECWKNK